MAAQGEGGGPGDCRLEPVRFAHRGTAREDAQRGGAPGVESGALGLEEDEGLGLERVEGVELGQQWGQDIGGLVESGLKLPEPILGSPVTTRVCPKE